MEKSETLNLSGEWLKLSKLSKSDKFNLKKFQSALKPENAQKNRYNDVFPYENTRVKLQERKLRNDYINANYVNIGNSQRVVVCQAPLPETFKDFWWMVWTHKSPMIIMLSKIIEGTRVKADVYWPTSTKKNLITTLDGFKNGFH